MLVRLIPLRLDLRLPVLLDALNCFWMNLSRVRRTREMHPQVSSALVDVHHLAADKHFVVFRNLGHAEYLAHNSGAAR